MKRQILEAAVQARQQEVLGYQINIDNYRLAIQHIDEIQDPDLFDFRVQLEGLLASEVIEQKKAKVMLAVISDQLHMLQNTGSSIPNAYDS